MQARVALRPMAGEMALAASPVNTNAHSWRANHLINPVNQPTQPDILAV